MSLERDVETHYTRGDLGAAVLDALQQAGKDIDNLALEDLAPIDEFHVRGRAATMELGRGLGLRSGAHVLDVGSGLGGPSRHLAATYGCRVTGIDLTAEYCRVAAMLAGRVGLSGRVDYAQANALATPFEDASFDAGYTQHVAMNIPDKAALYAEVARVLKPAGMFGIYDILRGAGDEVIYPAPWARDPATSFLVTPDELRGLLEGAGFEVVGWRDTTSEGRAWFQAMRQRIAEEGPPKLGFQLLLGPIFAEMRQNQVRNLAEDRIALIEAICRKV